MRQSFRSGLDYIFYGAPPLLSVMEQGFVQGQVLRCGDETDIPDTSHHQGGQGIVDHGLVINGHELLADAEGQRIQTGAGAACQQDTFP